MPAKAEAAPLLLLATLACQEPLPCPELDGVVDGPSELARLRGVERICGDLELRGELAELGELEALERVDGSLVVEGAAVEELELPRLRSVGGHLGVLDNAKLRRVELPVLEAVGGELAIVGNPALGDLRWPRLRRVETSLLVADNASLAALEAPALVELEALHINRNAALTQVSTPASLATLDGAIVAQNLALERLEFDGLSEGAGDVVVVDNPSLARVDLPEQGVLGSLAIVDNDQLTALALGHAERVVVEGNDALAELSGLGPGPDAIVVYVAGNTTLHSLGAHEVEHIGFVTVIHNPALAPEQALASVAGVDVSWLKIDGNLGQGVPHPDPCPWAEDFECDASEDAEGRPGTGLCASDPEDCGL